MKTETFENGDVKSVTFHRFQSKSEHLSKMADGLVMLTHAQSQVAVVSLFSSVLVWIGENDTKTLVWMKIFYFVFAEMNTDTFEHALVWRGLNLSVKKSDVKPLTYIHVYFLLGKIYFVGVQKPPTPGNRRLSCIDFVGEEICLVACKAGYEPEKPHANSYTYSDGQWSTSPDGNEFSWADCIAGKDSQLHFNNKNTIDQLYWLSIVISCLFSLQQASKCHEIKKELSASNLKLSPRKQETRKLTMYGIMNKECKQL